jgi:hypothetical protein
MSVGRMYADGFVLSRVESSSEHEEKSQEAQDSSELKELAFWSSGIHLIVLPNHKVGIEVSVTPYNSRKPLCKQPFLRKNNIIATKLLPRSSSPCFFSSKIRT